MSKTRQDPAVQKSLDPKLIDQTLLKPEATEAQIQKICEEALKHHFFGVCVNSAFIPFVAEKLKGSAVSPVAVIGFPLGAMATSVKAQETEFCINAGAKEIDMVLAIGRLKEKNFDFVREDIRAVVKAAGIHLVKVIIETSLLTEDEKRTACSLSMEAGAGFVKTSTGFNGGGATISDVKLMRAVVGNALGVKASGGVKSLEHALAMIQAGANRIGTSSGVELVLGQSAKGGY